MVTDRFGIGREIICQRENGSLILFVCPIIFLPAYMVFISSSVQPNITTVFALLVEDISSVNRFSMKTNSLSETIVKIMIKNRHTF